MLYSVYYVAVDRSCIQANANYQPSIELIMIQLGYNFTFTCNLFVRNLHSTCK